MNDITIPETHLAETSEYRPFRGRYSNDGSILILVFFLIRLVRAPNLESQIVIYHSAKFLLGLGRMRIKWHKWLWKGKSYVYDHNRCLHEYNAFPDWKGTIELVTVRSWIVSVTNKYCKYYCVVLTSFRETDHLTNTIWGYIKCKFSHRKWMKIKELREINACNVNYKLPNFFCNVCNKMFL